MTQNVVVGKRLSYWKGIPQKEMIIIFVVSPLCAVLAIHWFIGLCHVEDPFGDNFGGTLCGGLLSIAGLAIAAFGVWLFATARRTPVIASACPVCGIERARSFSEQPAPTKELAKLSKKARRRALQKAEDEGDPTECGACIAYLRIHIDTLEVREQSLDASDTCFTHYHVTSDQYLPLVKRGDDADHTLECQFPAMCAVCCATDAPLRRKIGNCDRGNAGDGAVLNALMWRSSRNPSPLEKSASEKLRDGLRGLETPVCANHRQTDVLGDALAYDNTTLRFASYGYYKAFCELNGITKGTRPSS